MSTTTETLSLLDLDFDFDHEILTSDVYRTARRANMRKDAIRKGKMSQRNNVLLEVMRENADEDPGETITPQIELSETQGLPSTTRYPQTNLQFLDEASKPGKTNHRTRQDSEIEVQKPLASLHEIQVERAVINNNSIPKHLPLLPLNKHQITQREANRRGKSTWKVWSQNRKLFPKSGGPNVLNTVAPIK